MVDLHDQLLLKIAFSNSKGITAGTALELLDRVGSLYDYFTLSQAELSNLTGISNDIFDDQYRQSLLQGAAYEAAYIRSVNVDAMFIGDDTYPHRLLNCEDAPVILYRYGNCDLDREHVIGIVGTRSCTAYGADFATRLVADLAAKVDDLLVVSGLAYGIDVVSHKASLANKVPTVGVLADGFKHLYPAAHRGVATQMAAHGGALLTEYPSDTHAHRQNFLARNRIIAGLSDCVVVVESDFRGGSMSTARLAQQYNRDVFAVPGRVSDRSSNGTNKLIADQVATLITNADDVIRAMGWGRKVPEPQVAQPQLFRVLAPEEEKILTFIQANPQATVNDICVQLGMSYSLASNILLALELDDIITILPGGRYAVTAQIQ